MDYSNKWLLAARRLGQKIGILRPLVRAYRQAFNVDYEQAFDHAVQSRIRPGDTVWDVGANIGFYSKRFAELAGPSGKVVAIEPSPSNLPQLETAAAETPGIVVRQVALSNETGEASFFLSKGGNSTVDGLDAASIGGDAVETKVPVMRGDTLAADLPPNLIKIDVEGFELEVLEGLPETLRNPALHTVAMEIHFSVLASRGKPDAPARIGALLETAGFAIAWTDPSHLVAKR